MTSSASAKVNLIQVVKDAAPSTRRLFPSLPYLALVFGLAAIGSSAIFVKKISLINQPASFLQIIGGIIVLAGILMVHRTST